MTAEQNSKIMLITTFMLCFEFCVGEGEARNQNAYMALCPPSAAESTSQSLFRKEVRVGCIGELKYYDESESSLIFE